MLYCELDNAFNNKTYKFQKSDDFNISNNQIMYENDKKGQESDWATIDSDTELLPKKKIKTMNKDDIISIDSESNNSNNNKLSPDDELVGTSLSKLVKNKKPTHRECIKLYHNPSLKSNYCFDIALKHISKCNLCKKEISKKKIVKTETKKETKKENNNENKTCSSSLNNFINDLREMKNNKIVNENLQFDNESLTELIKKTELTKKKNTQDNNKLALLQTQIDSQSPCSKSLSQSLLQQTQINENNIQLQNALIQNTIQKYFENMEEKKELNEKLNKIYDILNSEIKKNEIIDKERKYMSHLNNNTNNTNDYTYILLGICIIIILLIIDIVIRIKF